MTDSAATGADKARSGRRRPLNTRPRDALGRPLPYGSEGIVGPPSGVRRTPDDALEQASRLLADGLPFHAHEVLEDAWRVAPDVERELWRGLAQLAVGCTHAARGNTVGAQALLRRGAAAVGGYQAQSPHGVDIVGLLRWVDSALTEVGTESKAADLSPGLAACLDVSDGA